MWRKFVLFPLPLAFLWILLTGRVSVDSFLVGYVLSLFLSAVVAQDTKVNLHPARFPGQAFALCIYVILLFRDIFLSSIDVMLRILGFKPLRTGIIAVLIDRDENITNEDSESLDILGGLSAHSITITPGELVVDFSPDRKVMYVHCLDIDEAGPQLDIDQQNRERIFRRILGLD